MKIKQLKMPEENIEYTFRFPPKRILVYRWYGDMQRGRILLYNLTGKYYTGMTPVYFNFLLSNRLVQKKEVPEEEPKELPNVVKSAVTGQSTDQKKKPEEPTFTEQTDEEFAENIKFCDECIANIKKYSDNEKKWLYYVLKQQSVSIAEAHDINRLIIDFERAKGIMSDQEFSDLMCRYMKVDNLIKKHRADLGGLK